MSETTHPAVKKEIQAELSSAFLQLENHLTAYQETAFSSSFQGKWSAAEHLGHLILSAVPVGGVLKQETKEQLASFGFAEQVSRSYSDLLKAYQARLDAGQQADPKRMPDVSDLRSKAEMLQNWNGILQKILSRIDDWVEEDLDKYRVPHPALGLVTVRELLLFTIFHTKHHTQILMNRGI
jgi:DinB superfamily